MIDLTPRLEFRVTNPNGPQASAGGNSREIHIYEQLRAASPARRDQLAADMKARGLNASVIDELAQRASAAPTATPSLATLTAMLEA